MSRALPEWCGKTPDTPVPPRVRLRVFEAYGGKCYLSGRKIMAGDKWEVEHIIAIINGGENREKNLAPALKDAHREKTAEDLATKSNFGIQAYQATLVGRQHAVTTVACPANG
jgi:5-methylcytosine-specific restriction endonuclease McrA